MDISSIVAWVTTNWEEVVKAYLALVGLASVIVKLTPTLKDDDALKGIVKFLGKYIALNRTSGPNA